MPRGSNSESYDGRSGTQTFSDSDEFSGSGSYDETFTDQESNSSSDEEFQGNSESVDTETMDNDTTSLDNDTISLDNDTASLDNDTSMDNDTLGDDTMDETPPQSGDARYDVDTSFPLPPESPSFFGFMRGAFDKLVEGKEAIGKIAEVLVASPKAPEATAAVSRRIPTLDSSLEQDQKSLGSNISFIESYSGSYSDDGLSMDDTTMASVATAPNKSGDVGGSKGEDIKPNLSTIKESAQPQQSETNSNSVKESGTKNSTQGLESNTDDSYKGSSTNTNGNSHTDSLVDSIMVDSSASEEIDYANLGSSLDTQTVGSSSDSEDTMDSAVKLDNTLDSALDRVTRDSSQDSEVSPDDSLESYVNTIDRAFEHTTRDSQYREVSADDTLESNAERNATIESIDLDTTMNSTSLVESDYGFQSTVDESEDIGQTRYTEGVQNTGSWSGSYSDYDAESTESSPPKIDSNDQHVDKVDEIVEKSKDQVSDQFLENEIPKAVSSSNGSIGEKSCTTNSVVTETNSVAGVSVQLHLADEEEIHNEMEGGVEIAIDLTELSEPIITTSIEDCVSIEKREFANEDCVEGSGEDTAYADTFATSRFKESGDGKEIIPRSKSEEATEVERKEHSSEVVGSDAQSMFVEENKSLDITDHHGDYEDFVLSGDSGLVFSVSSEDSESSSQRYQQMSTLIPLSSPDSQKSGENSNQVRDANDDSLDDSLGEDDQDDAMGDAMSNHYSKYQVRDANDGSLDDSLDNGLNEYGQDDAMSNHYSKYHVSSETEISVEKQEIESPSQQESEKKAKKEPSIEHAEIDDDALKFEAEKEESKMLTESEEEAKEVQAKEQAGIEGGERDERDDTSHRDQLEVILQEDDDDDGVVDFGSVNCMSKGRLRDINEDNSGEVMDDVFTNENFVATFRNISSVGSNSKDEYTVESSKEDRFALDEPTDSLLSKTCAQECVEDARLAVVSGNSEDSSQKSDRDMLIEVLKAAAFRKEKEANRLKEEDNVDENRAIETLQNPALSAKDAEGEQSLGHNLEKDEELLLKAGEVCIETTGELLLDQPHLGEKDDIVSEDAMRLSIAVKEDTVSLKAEDSKDLHSETNEDSASFAESDNEDRLHLEEEDHVVRIMSESLSFGVKEEDDDSIKAKKEECLRIAAQFDAEIIAEIVAEEEERLRVEAENEAERLQKEEQELLAVDGEIEAARLQEEEQERLTVEAEIGAERLQEKNQERLAVDGEIEAARFQEEEQERLAVEAEIKAARLQEEEQERLAVEAEIEAARLQEEKQERLAVEAEIEAEIEAERLQEEKQERLTVEAEIEAARLQEEEQERLTVEAEIEAEIEAERFQEEEQERLRAQVDTGEQERLRMQAELELSRIKALEQERLQILEALEQERLRILAEQEAVKINYEIEQESARLRAEEEECLRLETEEAARLKAEGEERLRLEAEETARLQALEEERVRVEAEEEEILRHEAEETARLEASNLERLRIGAEEEAARLKVLEEERLRIEAEEAARLKAVEEERLRLEAEETARFQALEEERIRIEAEKEAARLKAEEEERLIIEAEQEAERIKEEEAYLLLKQAEEEVARLQAAVEARVLAEIEEKTQNALSDAEGKVQAMFLNFAATDEKLTNTLAGHVHISDEINRYKSTVVQKSSSPWWLSDEIVESVVEESDEADVAAKIKAKWFMQQLQQSDAALLERPHTSAGQTKQRSNMQQSSDIWWHAPEQSENLRKPDSRIARAWYFDATEQENEIDMSTFDVSKQDDCNLPTTQRRKVTNITTRSWFVESDSREKVLSGVEEVQPSPGISIAVSTIKEEQQPLEIFIPESIPILSDAPQSVESAITVLKFGIAKAIHALDNGNTYSDTPVTFKNPVPTIASREIPNSDEILKKHTKRRKAFENRYIAPKPQIRDLLEALNSDSASRRSNASGTLKLMASQKKNVAMLGSSLGLMDSLVRLAKIEAIGADYEAILVSRNRAMISIALICQGKENRRAICEHSELINFLFDTIKSNDHEGRLHSCSAFAALAKTEENRDILAEKDGLIVELAKLLDSLKESGLESLTDEERASMNMARVAGEQKIAASTRLNVCAALLHLSKQCTVSVRIYETTCVSKHAP